MSLYDEATEKEPCPPQPPFMDLVYNWRYRQWMYQRPPEYILPRAQERQPLADTTVDELVRMMKHIDEVYTERNTLVALLMKFCLELGLPAGMQLAPLPREKGWLYIAYFELPTGQCSFPIPDSELSLFEGMPLYRAPWDNHSKQEKYQRIRSVQIDGLQMKPWGYLYQDFNDVFASAMGLPVDTFSTKNLQRLKEEDEDEDEDEGIQHHE